MPATAILETPSPEVANAYRIAESYFGHVPNFVKVLGTNPAFCNSITEFVIEALGEGRVSWAFKELAIMKTLRASGSYYGYGAHEKLAVVLPVAGMAETTDESSSLRFRVPADQGAEASPRSDFEEGPRVLTEELFHAGLELYGPP